MRSGTSPGKGRQHRGGGSAPSPDGVAGKERLGTLVALVQEVVAGVLGLAGAAAVPANQPLKELGLDSLMAVEVRNRLAARAETTLPTTLVFDYPTPEAIAKLLLRQLLPSWRRGRRRRRDVRARTSRSRL